MFEARIIDMPAIDIIGFETRFIHALSPDSNAGTVLGAVWGKLLEHLNKIPHRADASTYGIITDLPESERSHDDELLYIAGASVTSISVVPDGMAVRSIPAGQFAVFTHLGPIQQLGETCFQIYRE